MGPDENGRELSTPASALAGSLALLVWAGPAVSAPPCAEEPGSGEGATWTGAPLPVGGCGEGAGALSAVQAGTAADRTSAWTKRR
jgi:hypothetical protein